MELVAFQQIEPTGQTRIEIYLAKILAHLKAEPGKQYFWQDELIGSEEHEQTPEEMLDILQRSLGGLDGSN